jgi:hypothetical protein
LIEQVVLPTPPFWFAIEITLVNASPSCGSAHWFRRPCDCRR